MSMKNCSGTIGNPTRDLPVCSAVPQPTAPPHVRFLSNLINVRCTVLRNLFFSYVFQSLSSTLCFTMANRAAAVKDRFCAPQVRRSQRRRVIIQTYSEASDVFFLCTLLSDTCSLYVTYALNSCKIKLAVHVLFYIRDYGLFSNKRADEFSVTRRRRGYSDF